jgi:hypothetical protein
MSCYATQLHFMRRIANDNASVNTTTRSAFKRAIVGSDEQLEGRSADGSGSGYGWPGWELVREMRRIKQEDLTGLLGMGGYYG